MAVVVNVLQFIHSLPPNRYGLSWIHGSSLELWGNGFGLIAMNGTVHRHVGNMAAAVLFYLWLVLNFRVIWYFRDSIHLSVAL